MQSYTFRLFQRLFIVCIIASVTFSGVLLAQDSGSEVQIPQRLLDMSVSNLMQEGNQLYNNGDYKEARPYFLAIVQKDTSQAGVYDKLSEVEYNLFDLSQSLNYLRQAIELEPNNEEYRARYNTINQMAQTMSDGRTAVDDRNYEEALKQFNSILQQDKNFAPAHYNMGLVYSRQGDTKQSVEHIQQAISLDPSNERYAAALENLAKTHFNNGVQAFRRGNLSGAEEGFENAVSIDENFAQAYYMLGVISRRRGNVNQAIEYYQTALDNAPENEAVWYALGIAYKSVNRNTQALESFTEATELNSNYAKAWKERGEMLRGMDKYAEAINSYQRAIQADPQYVSAYEGLGLAYMQQGQYQMAAEQYNTALSFEETAMLYYRLSDAYIEIDNWEEAKSAAQNSISRKPNFGGSLVNLGIAECHLGNGQAAVSAWQKGASDSQWRSVANHHIEIYEKSGECP